MDTSPDGQHDGNNTVILLHGGVSCAINSFGDFNGIIETLVDSGFRVIAHDYRGHGSSDKPHAASEYGPKLVEDVKRLADHLKLDKFHIAGYSFGAENAIAFTVKYPARVLSLTTGGSGWSTEALVKSLKTVGAIFGSCCCLACNMCCDVQQCLVPTQLAYHKGPNKKLHPDVKYDLKAFSALFKAGGATINVVSLTEADMRGIAVPVLSVFGEKDPEVGNGLRMEGVVPNLIRIVIPGFDHEGALCKDPEYRLDFWVGTQKIFSPTKNILLPQGWFLPLFCHLDPTLHAPVQLEPAALPTICMCHV